MFLKTTVKVPIDRSVVAARRRLCGGGGGGKRGEMRLGEKEEEEAVLVAPISQFLTTSNIRMRSGAISAVADSTFWWIYEASSVLQVRVDSIYEEIFQERVLMTTSVVRGSRNAKAMHEIL